MNTELGTTAAAPVDQRYKQINLFSVRTEGTIQTDAIFDTAVSVQVNKIELCVL